MRTDKMKIKPLTRENYAEIIRWNDGKDADFLRQWAGRGYEFPLTEVQLETRISNGAKIFAAIKDDKIVGTIEITNPDDTETANLGRFIVNPALTGKGLGTEILNEMKNYCKTQGYKKLTLCVFDFNKSAYRCYEKCGFTETDSVLRDNGWRAVNMAVAL